MERDTVCLDIEKYEGLRDSQKALKDVQDTLVRNGAILLYGYSSVVEVFSKDEILKVAEKKNGQLQDIIRELRLRRDELYSNNETKEKTIDNLNQEIKDIKKMNIFLFLKWKTKKVVSLNSAF